MILTALSSAYSRYKPKNPLSEEAPWLLKNQVYKTLTLRAFLKTKKKNNFRWTNFINRKLILKKFFE